MDEGFERFVLERFRNAGRHYAEVRNAYRDGWNETTGDGDGEFDLPRDDDGKARIVCRRYAEKRSVAVDSEGRPTCFDPDHPDCRGCAEDVREGVVETW